jgi:DNA-binding transcriptional MerR regulator
MKMRELELRTGVHREVIRVYLRDGLIPQPERPSRTHAIYGEEHVQAIATVRRLQSESRLTLAQIKSLMNGDSADVRLEASAFDRLEQLVAHRTGGDGQPVLVESLVDRYPDAVGDARTLHEIGILKIIETPQGATLSISDAQLVRIWGEMRKNGFEAEVGYTPDVLAFYTQASDVVGRYEAESFLERTTGRISVEKAATMIEHALPLMLDFFGLLRKRAFLRHIHAHTVKPDR